VGGRGLLPGLSPPPAVISASRRTDLPAYHSHWLLQRLRDGECQVRHPFNGTVRAVDLRPEAVLALVLWTRDPRPLLPAVPELVQRGYRLLFHVTINDYPAYLEPGAAPVAAVVAALGELRAQLGPEAIVWRYDPVILTTHTDAAYHRDQIDTLAAQLAGISDSCVTSWVDLYRKTERNLLPALERAGVQRLPEDPARDRALVRDMAERVGERNIQLTLCCEPDLVQEGIPPTACVDPGRISRVVGREVRLPRRPTRPGCACHASIDIGAYDSCPRGCVYCYACRTPGKVSDRI
jgi:Domain of unknown function (DUF1848)